MGDIVKLEINGHVAEFKFQHALNLLRLQKKQGRSDFKVVGNHEFIDNELIIKSSTKEGGKSTKQNGGKGGRKVRKSSKDTDGSV